MLSRQLLRHVSVWKNVPQGPPDPILGISEAFKRCENPQKVNLGVGAYRDDNNKPLVLPSVRAAEELIFNSKMDHEYLPTEGLESFTSASVKLAYGANSEVVTEKRVAKAQCLSGTGSLRLGFAYLSRFYNTQRTVYIANPTWGNHKTIIKDAGLEWKEYTYYDKELRGINIDAMCNDLQNAPNGSIVLLHACAHNPTGADPTDSQWERLSQLMKEKEHVAFFDSAYQGFASGSVDNDANAIRKFVQNGHQVLLAQSFAKNFGLYGQRVGCLSVIGENEEEAQRITSQLKIIGRAIYSNPPLHGARIVSTVLNSDNLREMWFGDVKEMADRIISMRQGLRQGLQNAGSQLQWDHVTNQIGMFAYTGMTKEQCERITRDFHIYLTMDGRISVAGLNTSNVNYVANAIHEVTR